jgi:hypothetical protein
VAVAQSNTVPVPVKVIDASAPIARVFVLLELNELNCIPEPVIVPRVRVSVLVLANVGVLNATVPPVPSTTIAAANVPACDNTTDPLVCVNVTALELVNESANCKPNELPVTVIADANAILSDVII